MQKQIIEKAIELGFSKHIYELKQTVEAYIALLRRIKSFENKTM